MEQEQRQRQTVATHSHHLDASKTRLPSPSTAGATTVRLEPWGFYFSFFFSFHIVLMFFLKDNTAFLTVVAVPLLAVAHGDDNLQAHRPSHYTLQASSGASSHSGYTNPSSMSGTAPSNVAVTPTTSSTPNIYYFSFVHEHNGRSFDIYRF